MSQATVRMRHGGRSAKIKVVTLVGKPGRFGGGERLASEVTRGLDPDRFERTLCISRPPPRLDLDVGYEDWAQGMEGDGVRLLVLERQSRTQITAWSPLIRLLRRERVELIHGHMFGSNVWAAVLGHACRIPAVVAHEHTWSFEGQPLRRFLDRELIARWSDALIAVSREDRRRMIEIEGIDPDDIVFIPNGIPDPPANPQKDVRRELGIEAGAPVIGTVSVMRPQKALDVLIHAAARLRPSFPDLAVLIAGPGAQRPVLERLIEELDLTACVRLLGPRTDVPDLLRAFDVAVCCSDFEGSPLSVMEYMQAALPVVATRVGGVPDLVVDGVTGLLVERRDPAGLADALAGLLTDPGRRAEMGRRGAERQRAEFDIAVMVERIEALYLELLDDVSAHRRR